MYPVQIVLQYKMTDLDILLHVKIHKNIEHSGYFLKKNIDKLNHYVTFWSNFTNKFFHNDKKYTINMEEKNESLEHELNFGAWYW